MRSNGAGRAWLAALGVAAAFSAQACGDGDETGGSGGSSATSTTTATTTTTTTTGGEGGGGGATTGTGGGGGGVAETCLDASEHAAWFTIDDASLCAVAVHEADMVVGYDAATGYVRVPTWGRHGGPLTMTPTANGGIDLTRWQPPADAQGALTKMTMAIAAGLPAGGYAGAQAIDLPFFGWTAISWTGAFPSTQGEVVLIAGNSVATRYDVNGFYAGASLSVVGGDAGRLVYAGLSAIEDAASSANAIYAADSCGTTAASPSLVPGVDATCTAPAAVAAWGDASGPVASDTAGHVFAVLASFGADQEARGFAADTVARGAAPTSGDTLFTMPGFGASLAAIAPSATDDGWLLFQANDAASFETLDVVAQRYKAIGSTIQPQGGVTTVLSLATAGTTLAMMTDADDRLWVGVPHEAGGTTFVVVARRP